MESRNLLAAVAWDGGGDGISFNDADNWSNDLVPSVADDVTIGNVDNTPFEVQLLSGATVNSLNLAFEDATLFVPNNRQLTINGDSTIDAGTLRLANGARVVGPGTLINRGQITVESNGTRITPTSFIQQGMLDIGVEGGFTTASLITNGFTNEGTIRLGSSTNTLATLQSNTGGTVINDVGGEIIVDASVSGRARLLTDLENDGSFDVNADLSFEQSNATLSNRGSIDVENDARLTIGGPVVGVEFIQQDGQLNVDGEVLFQRIEVQLNGGEINSDHIVGSQIILADSDLSYGEDLIGGSTIRARRVNDLESNLPLGHTIRTQATSVDGRLNVPDNFVNEGSLVFEALDGSTRATDLRTLTTSQDATIFNAVSGTIDVLPGGTFTLTQGNLVNEGSVTLDRTTLVRGNQQLTNRSEWTVGPNGDLTVQAQFSSQPSFVQEAGALNVQGSLTMISTDFDFSGGTIAAGSNILVDNGDITIADGNANPFTIEVENAVELFGDLQSPGQQIDVFASPGRSGRLIVEEGFVNAGRITFNSRDGALNSVDLLTRSPSTTSTITNAAGGVIDVNAGAGLFQLLNVGNFVNQGEFTLDRTTLIRGDQQLTNQSDWTVEANGELTVQTQFGAEPSFVQEAGALNVQGSLKVIRADLDFSGGTIAAGSNILVDGGDITIADGNANPFLIVAENGVELFGDLQSPGQQIDVFASPGRSGSLTVEEGFVNAGTITFNSRDGALNSVDLLTRSPSTTSTITNAAGGVIDINAGSGLFQLLNVGNFVNQGEFTIDRDMILRGTQTIDNHGAFEIEPGSEVQILRQFTADPAFRQSAGSLQVDGQLSILTSRFEFDGGVISGVPKLRAATLEIAEGNQGNAVFKVVDESVSAITTRLMGDLNEAQTIIVETNGTATGSQARLLVEDDFANSGTVQLTSAAGVVGRSKLETSITGNIVNTATGVLTGDGEIQTNDLENQGTIAPGNGVGRLLIDANLNQAETATIELELDGVTGVGFDELAIEHAFRVDGDLSLFSATSFMPALGTTFQVITHDQVEGDFSFVNGTDLGNGTLLEKSILADQVRLLVRTPPELTVEDLTVTESDAGTVEALVTVSLQETSNPVRVDFATQAGSANPIEDFWESSGQLEFAANETSKTLTIPIVGDLRDEDPESLAVILSNTINAVSSDPSGEITILDNGDPQPEVEVAVTESDIQEGTGEISIEVNLSRPSGVIVSVDFTVTGGTAVLGEDIALAGGTLVFAPDQLSQTITIPVIDDAIFEAPETLRVELSNPVRAMLGTQTFHDATIINDDAPLVVNPLADVTIEEDGDELRISILDVFNTNIAPFSVQSQNESLVRATLEGSEIVLALEPNQNGTTSIVLTAGELGLQTQDVFEVSVTAVNDAPMVANPIADVTVDEDAAAQTLDLSDVFTDIDSPSLTLSAVSSDGSLVSTSLSGNVLTLSFAADQNGAATVTVTADDGELTASDTFNVTVNAVNDAPIVANPIGDVIVDEDAADQTLDFSDVFADIDSANLTLSAVSSDGSLVSTSLSGNVLTLSFAADQNGAATVTVTADDGELTASDTFNVTVNAVNDAPMVANPIADVTVDEDAAAQTLDLSDVFTDIDSPSLTLSAVSSDGSLVSTSLSGNVLTLSFAADQNGAATVTVTADDGELTASDTFNVTVNAVNDAPMVANPIADVTVDEDAAAQTLDLSDVFTDIDSPSLTLSAVSSDGSLVSTSLSGNVLTLSFAADQNGAATVTVTADDGELTASDTFNVTVNAVNDAPMVANPIADVTVDEDAAAQTLDLSDVFTDIDSPSLTLSAVSSDGSLVSTSLSGNVLMLSFAADQNGSATVTVTADDGELTTSDTFNVTANAVNDAPIVANPLAGVTVDEDAAAQTFDLSDVFADIDSANLTLSAVSSDGSLVSTSLSGNLLTLSFAADQNGAATVTVTADDGELTVSDTFNVTVNAVNDAPVLANPLTDLTVERGSADRTIDLSAVLADIDSANLTLVVASSDASIANPSLDGSLLTLSFANNQVGAATITVTASDGEFSVEDSFTVTVSGTDDQVVELIGRVLRVTGDLGQDDRDRVQLNLAGSKIKVSVKQGSDKPQKFEFAAASIDSVEVNLNDGNDVLQTSGNFRKPIIVNGGAGNDRIETGRGDDTVVDLLGNNVIKTGAGSDRIETGDGRDKIYSGSGSDLVRAGGGNDLVNAGSGSDIVLGGAGNDILLGGSGRDLLIGGLGCDILYGGSGQDLLIGGATVHDSHDASLEAIAAEWTSSRSLSQRKANITDGSGSAQRRNGEIFLGTGDLIDDHATDLVFGGSDKNWKL